MATPVAPAPPPLEPRIVHLAPTARCANCDTPVDDAFCPHCGQEQHDLHRSLRSVFGELLDSVAGWDGKIPMTLWLLVRHPGRLTTEFLAGRRARYLRPMRLYLTLSLVFFLSLRWPGGSSDAEEAGERAQPAHADSARTASHAARAARAAGDSANGTQGDSIARAVTQLFGDDSAASRRGSSGTGIRGDSAGWVRRLKPLLMPRIARWQAMSKEQRGATFRNAFTDHMSSMVFALVPVFALLLWVVYWRAPLYLAEHFVHALHLHAIAMLLLTTMKLLSPSGWAAVPMAAIPVYLWLSLRRVYPRSALGTTARLVVVGGLYGVALIVALTVAAALVFLFSA